MHDHPTNTYVHFASVRLFMVDKRIKHFLQGLVADGDKIIVNIEALQGLIEAKHDVESLYDEVSLVN